MERAGKFIRRSGARLKSIGAGHSDLVVLISELKCMRATIRALITAQSTIAEDILKWSVDNENRAIQDTATQMAELNLLWTEVQKEFAGIHYLNKRFKNNFTESLKDFKHQFEMILEGEQHMDLASKNLLSCEQRELKLKKELKKASRTAKADEIHQLELQLAQAERAKDLAQLEAMDRIQENEAVKLIRFKEGLLRVSEAYIRFACKCQSIFEAQREIANQLPDVHDCDLSEIKYTGAGASKLAVMHAKEKVRSYCSTQNFIKSTPEDEPPPPYSPYTVPNDYITFYSEDPQLTSEITSQLVPRTFRGIQSSSLNMSLPDELIHAMEKTDL